MNCLIAGHKFVEIKDEIICEKCGKKWQEKKKEDIKPAIILTKEPKNLEKILEDIKNEY